MLSLQRLKPNSIKGLLLFYIMSITTVLVLLVFWIVNDSIKQQLRESAFQKAHILSFKALRDIEQYLYDIRDFTDYSAKKIKQNPQTYKTLLAIMYENVKEEPSLYGSALAIKDDFEKNYCKYVYKKDLQVVQKDLKLPKYDCQNSDWFLDAKNSLKPKWSKPYFDNNGGEILMSTFSQPLIDENNNFFGVITADASIELLSKKVQEIKLFGTGYAMLILDNGEILTHPNNGLNLKKNILNYPKSPNTKYDKMLNEKIFNITIKSKEYVLYIDKIESTPLNIAILFSNDELFASIHHLQKILILVIVIAMILLLLSIVVISHKLTHELSIVADMSKEIAKGDFDLRLPKNFSNEAGSMVDAMEYMQHSLKIYIEKLKETTVKEGLIQHELELANKIQHSFLPEDENFSLKNLVDLSAVMIPAKEVGGDFYGYRYVDDKLVFYLGDVSGKGIPSSLFMMASHMMIENALDEKLDPSYVIQRTNIKLTQMSKRGMFATLLIAVLDLRTKELVFSCAGHPPPIISQKDTMFSLIPDFAPPIGIFEDIKYKNRSYSLKTKSKLIVYTDGISEALDVKNELYGSVRLCNTFKQNHLLSSLDIKDKIIKAVKEFSTSKEQSDDITLIVLDVK